MQLGLAVIARTLLAIYGTALFTALAVDMLVLLPLRAEGSLSEFYDPLSNDRIFWIVTLVALWAVSSAAVIVGLIIRLRSPRTWRWSYPNSWWRVARSVILITGWICLGSYIPGYIVGTPPTAGDSVELTARTWEIGIQVFVVGVFSFLTVIVMYSIGGLVIVIRSLTSGKRQSNLGSL